MAPNARSSISDYTISAPNETSLKQFESPSQSRTTGCCGEGRGTIRNGAKTTTPDAAEYTIASCSSRHTSSSPNHLDQSATTLWIRILGLGRRVTALAENICLLGRNCGNGKRKRCSQSQENDEESC